jgi:hypothetical protein
MRKVHYLKRVRSQIQNPFCALVARKSTGFAKTSVFTSTENQMRRWQPAALLPSRLSCSPHSLGEPGSPKISPGLLQRRGPALIGVLATVAFHKLALEIVS